MAKIGLIDVDGHSNFPNLALMKLSAWHKAQGDAVEFADPMFGRYDRIYKSKVFTFTPDNFDIYQNTEIIKGGTGYGLIEPLPDEVDTLQPDYTLYGVKDLAYGFVTRGCVNNCPWCIVPRKEGGVRPYMKIKDIARGNNTKNLVLMDNNVLASDFGLDQIKIATDEGYKVDFNQGLDARQITPEIAELLARLKWLKHLRLACDTSAMIPTILRVIKQLRIAGYNGEIFIFTLLRDDFWESYNRVNLFWEMRNQKIIPYAQGYIDFSGKRELPQWQKDMMQWVNKRMIFKSCKFDDFEPRKGFFCREYKQFYKQ